MRVLILTASYGSGHNAAAQSLAGVLTAAGASVTVVDHFRDLVHPAFDRLSRGLLETLSIVAYRQPVARPEIERIRGVQAGDALRALLDRRLLKVVGRSDQPGHPLLYGTTKRFLTVFGLNDLKDLPSAKDLARL